MSLLDLQPQVAPLSDVLWVPTKGLPGSRAGLVYPAGLREAWALRLGSGGCWEGCPLTQGGGSRQWESQR